MIVIYSEAGDFSTNKVIDWLIFFRKKFKRYNGNSNSDNEIKLFDSNITINISNSIETLHIDNGIESISNNNCSIWFRRPNKGIAEFIKSPLINYCKIDDKTINRFLERHYSIFKELISGLFSQCDTLGSYQRTGLNKSIALCFAKKHGLKIPNTLITNDIKKVRKFYLDNNSKIVCKALYECISDVSPDNKNIFIEYTKLLNSLERIPKKFGVSLFQEYIEKDFELRVVFLKGEIFAMCIFSQRNTKTQIDFRRYDKRKPNRMVPYNLDSRVKSQISSLMGALELDMGSIDLIKGTDGNLYFLEINPVGQYDFVSHNCNYNIHMKIAQHLCHEKENTLFEA